MKAPSSLSINAPLILVTGASGQLGQTLARLWHTAPPSNQFEFLALARSELDITNPQDVEATLSTLKPAVIVNTAAYTQVDKAESDSDSAYLVNDAAVANLVSWAAHNESKIIQLSTDFVFDGSSQTPYIPENSSENNSENSPENNSENSPENSPENNPEQKPAPLNIYGHSKLAGEKQLQALPKENSTVIRTSWLYSEYGNNFVKTMLRLMQEKDALSVVNDQIGSPSSTHGLAQLIFAMILNGEYQGVYHWNDGGSISWFEFAQKIQQQALAHGLLNQQIPIRPITSSEYPTPAARPAYSVLDRSRAIDAFDCPDLNWQQQLEAVIKVLAT